MEQLSLVCSGSSEADLTSSGLGSGGRNVVVKPVIPPKPEGYGTLGRSGHRSENGSSSAEQNRMSYSSQRPKSTEMLTDFASTSTTSRQSPRSPRSKPPAPPVPSSSGSGGSGGGASCVGNSNGSTRLPPPPPSVASLSLADGQGSLLAGLALDCPCPLPPLLSSSSTSQLQHQSGGPGSKSSAFEPPQLSVWNPLIEPPQLFQTSMDVDLSAAFDSLGQVDPPPLPPPTVNNSCSSGSSSHTPADSHSITSHLVITKPAPPPPSLSQSQSQVSSSFPASSSSTSSSATSTTTSSSSTSSFHSYSGAEPIKPMRIDPPRLPSVPPVAHSGLSLQLDPLSRPYSSASTTRTVNATSTTAAEPPLQYISSGSSSNGAGGGGGGGSKPILPITNELNKLFKADQAQGNSYSSGGAGNSGYSSSSGPSRMEPRVTTDLVRLTEPNRISVEHHSHSTAVSTPTEPFKPSRVLPLKPFPDPPGTAGGGGSGALVPALHNHHQQQQQQQQLQTTTGKSTSATVSDRPSSDRQSLDSIHSNPSTIDTTDSPRSLLASNDTLNTPSNTQQRNTPESQKNQQQGPLGPSQQQQQQANGRVEHSNSTDSAAKNTSGPAVPPNVLQPAPSAPAAPPPSSSSSSYMTIDIDRGDPSMAGNTGGTVSSGAGGGGGGGGSEPGTEKVVDFYPPHSFVPYSFHSECWRKEIPDNETKWQMYKRRFCEFVFEFTACCIRCIGPV